MLLNERHAIHDLIQHELRVPGAVLYPSIERSSGRFALAASGVGLDHHVGEETFVLVDQSGKGSLQPCMVVTDRRVFGSLGFDVRFELVERLEKKGTLVPKLLVSMRGGKVEAVPAGYQMDALARFLTRIGAIPPGHREPPARPLCAPSESDPTGARTASAWLGVPDDRTTVWLDFVDAAHVSGLMPVEMARDLVARIVLHHRNLHFGRGMSAGRFMSPISSNDLSNAMVALYGNPIAHTETPLRMLDFDTRLRTESGAALASSAIGLASMALLGVGWVSTAQQRVPAMRFLVADTGCHASFRLQERSGRELHVIEPGLVHEIDVKLLAREDAILERRIAFGWNATTPELLAISERAVAARFAEILGSGEPERAPSDGRLRAAVAAVLENGIVDLEDQDNLIVLQPPGDFEGVRARYLAHLEREGWSKVAGSETDGSSVARMLAEMGQHAAAALAASKSIYGASFSRGGMVFALNIDSMTKRGQLQVQLSRIS